MLQHLNSHIFQFKFHRRWSLYSHAHFSSLFLLHWVSPTCPLCLVFGVCPLWRPHDLIAQYHSCTSARAASHRAALDSLSVLRLSLLLWYLPRPIIAQVSNSSAPVSYVICHNKYRLYFPLLISPDRNGLNRCSRREEVIHGRLLLCAFQVQLGTPQSLLECLYKSTESKGKLHTRLHTPSQNHSTPHNNNLITEVKTSLKWCRMPVFDNVWPDSTAASVNGAEWNMLL